MEAEGAWWKTRHAAADAATSYLQFQPPSRNAVLPIAIIFRHVASRDRSRGLIVRRLRRQRGFGPFAGF